MDDPEFLRMVDEAAQIAASGRWEAANARIRMLAANPEPHEAWWIQLFASLCSQVFSEYLSLKSAYNNPQPDDAALLAWRARNLLELSAWSVYSAKNRDNARRVYEDSGRDERDIFDSFMKWGATTKQPEDWFHPLQTAKDDVLKRAQIMDGIESLDGSYKHVTTAAKEADFGDLFSVNYKVFSKFAHPTAMRILDRRDPRKEALRRDWFFSHGCMLFTGGFGALEQALFEHAARAV